MAGPEAVGMASGATIHTANGLRVRVKARSKAAAKSRTDKEPAGALA